MKTGIAALAGLLLVASSTGHAKPSEAPRPSVPAAPVDFRACGGDRLTIMNFYKRYKTVRNALFAEGYKKQISVPELLERWELPTRTEQCAWDRFFFVDSVLYFQMESNLVPNLGANQPPDLHLQLLNIRNRFYRAWLDSLALHKSTGFGEWENHNVRGTSFREYLEKGSDQFGFVEFVSGIFNPAPFWGESESEEAGAYVYRLLQAKTPFSAVMPELSLNEAIRPEVASSVSCVHEAVTKFECGQNLWDLALACSEQRDPGIAIEVLGMFSSQRLYLIRDLKAWVEQNMTPEIATRVFDVFRKGSEIYFLTETIGNRCGSEGLFPKGTDVTHATVKNYHFWAEAAIASKLAEMGFNRAPALDAALAPARMYKQTISKVGVLYNWLLGAPSGAGTSGDVDQVLKEQKLGAEFGYDTGRAELPVGLYKITTPKLPSPIMIREIMGWNLVPGGMAITLLEIDPGPEMRQGATRYTLKFGDHTDYLRMKRVIEPRVLLTEQGFRVFY